MLILTRFILGFLPALRMPGWVPISYSSLISKTFVCSSLLLPTKKKMCLHCFPWQKGSSSWATGFLRLSWDHKMGHRAGSLVKFLLFPTFFWSKTSPTVFGTRHPISKHSRCLARDASFQFSILNFTNTQVSGKDAEWKSTPRSHQETTD